jgi:integrase/recombinase XerD
MIKWAKAEGETIDAKGQLPRLPKKLVNVLSREEMQAMEDAAGNERDKLIVRLLADTGIRVGGLVNLRVTDIVDHDRRPLLRVREKGGGGGSERLVPIPKLHRRLQRYIERGRKSDALSDRVFLGLRRGRSGEYEPLTESGVEQLIRTVAIQAEIKRPVYPHLLRHSYATWALSKGMNPIQLAQILGHSSLKMIQNVYAHLSPGDAYEATLRLFQAED